MTAEEFWESCQRDPQTDCWNWTRYRLPSGYGRLWFRGGIVYAHRLAYELTHGQIGQGLVICHQCDNPACINPGHLFAGTQGDNMADRDQKGRVFRPTEDRISTAAVLNPDAVRDIRAKRGVVTARELARMYGCAPATIKAVWARRSWGWVV